MKVFRTDNPEQRTVSFTRANQENAISAYWGPYVMRLDDKDDAYVAAVYEIISRPKDSPQKDPLRAQVLADLEGCSASAARQRLIDRSKNAWKTK